MWKDFFLLFANSNFDDDREGGGYMDGNIDDDSVHEEG